MLATLERGIKGGKWYSLIDKVWKKENLQSAVEKVARGKSTKKPDGCKCRRYLEQSSWRLPPLQEKLKQGDYRPRPVHRVWIPKLGSKELRPLGVPTVEDRVVQMALRNVLEPIFEHTFAEHSYGFRPGRGAKDALRRVQQLLDAGKTRIVDATQRGGFDFLGYHCERGYRWLRKKSLDKFKAAIRQKTLKLRSGSLSEITEDLNRMLCGWFDYFKHSHWTTFKPLDAWIRQRLRTLLRKRHKGQGLARGRDHQRWPNAYFAELGLISLTTTRVKASQSHAGGH